MKVVVIFAALVGLVVAQEAAPRYACPENDVRFDGNDIGTAETATWEECGQLCNLTDGCNFWSWHTDDYICNLKDSDGAGLEEHDNRISGARGCPEDADKKCGTTFDPCYTQSDCCPGNWCVTTPDYGNVCIP